MGNFNAIVIVDKRWLKIIIPLILGCNSMFKVARQNIIRKGCHSSLPKQGGVSVCDGLDGVHQGFDDTVERDTDRLRCASEDFTKDDADCDSCGSLWRLVH